MFLISPDRAVGGMATTSIEQNAFGVLADEIFDGLTKFEDDIFGHIKNDRVRIAIWPFAENIPVSMDQASEFNNDLMVELVARADSRYAFVAREDLDVVIKALTESGEGTDDPVAIVSKHAKVDILVIGKMRVKDDALYLRYKAVGVAIGTTLGRILAPTRAYKISDLSLQLGTNFKQSIGQLARFFRERAISGFKHTDHIGDLYRKTYVRGASKGVFG
jgi:hypothetical protein